MHAELKEELEREKEVVNEIDACDPEQLEGLKAGIAEQEWVSFLPPRGFNLISFNLAWPFKTSRKM